MKFWNKKIPFLDKVLFVRLNSTEGWNLVWQLTVCLGLWYGKENGVALEEGMW